MTDLDIKEIKDRLRRIETRFTRWLESQGFDTETQRPCWREAGVIEVPTRMTSIKDMRDVVPRDWDPREQIDVYCKHDYLMTVLLTRG